MAASFDIKSLIGPFPKLGEPLNGSSLLGSVSGWFGNGAGGGGEDRRKTTFVDPKDAASVASPGGRDGAAANVGGEGATKSSMDTESREPSPPKRKGQRAHSPIHSRLAMESVTPSAHSPHSGRSVSPATAPLSPSKSGRGGSSCRSGGRTPSAVSNRRSAASGGGSGGSMGGGGGSGGGGGGGTSSRATARSSIPSSRSARSAGKGRPSSPATVPSPGTPTSVITATSGAGLAVSGAKGAKAADNFDAAGADLRVLRKAEAVLQRRTDQIIVVVERCTATHNYTAVIRTAEALGIQHVWLIAPPSKDGSAPSGKQQQKPRKKDRWVQDEKELKSHIAYARMACNWITVREFARTSECIEALREEGRTIWVTDLGQRAHELTRDRTNLPARMAIVFGTESTGCSEEMLAAADRRVYLPLHGFADSLNLSVAAALVLQHLFYTCPSAVGAMPDAQKRELRRVWYAKLARSPEEGRRYAALVDAPPPPFTDLRRPDAHRVGWQPKKVKRKNEENWQGNY